jgi:hypothetical protein
MLTFLRAPLAAGYLSFWILVLYGGLRLPSVNTSPQKIVVIAVIVAAHVMLGALLRTWWACGLALVPLVAAVLGVKEWPLLVYYVPPIALTIAVGVGAARLHARIASRGR